jgi:hypothetical protein
MSQQHNALAIQEGGRLNVALSAYITGQFKSLRRAAAAFNVPHQRLSNRLHGITSRAKTRPNRQKLTTTEEQTIVQYILDLDSRGFAPRLCEVADMADKLLGVRGGEPVGKHWAERFVTRSDELKIGRGYCRRIQRQLARDLNW